MTCRNCVVAGMLAGCLAMAAACLAEEGAAKQKYSEWMAEAGTEDQVALYEATAEPGKSAKGVIELKCIIRAKEPRYAYYINPANDNKCWCRYDFENATFETIKDADQRKLGDLNERAFRRVKGAPIVPGSTQVALAPPKRPAQTKAVP
jgi:hypothetical protein